MKVIIVNTSDIRGGASRAAHRLHQAFLKSSLDSQMLVQFKCSEDHTILALESKLQKSWAKLRPTLDSIPSLRYKNRTEALFSPAWLPFSRTVNYINSLNPDIVHLHWVCSGMIPLKDFAKIKAPIVWSLHDMWAFTGGCHYSQHCEGYKYSCGDCIVLNSGQFNDLSHKILKRKFKYLLNESDKLTVVGLSKWLANCAKESALFKDTKVVNLPNPIDTEVFSPINKHIARSLLNLPQDRKLVIFGAMGATSDPRKGFQVLQEALSLLVSKDVELVIFGCNEPSKSQGFRFKAHYLGQLHDDLTLRIIYNSADVLLVPSLQENLSNVIMESLSCGTPVVGFDVGGNSDLIDHKISGYLSKPYSPIDLAKGIDWVIQHEKPDSLSVSARDKALSCFNQDLVAKRYLNLYQQILLRGRSV